MKWVLPATLLAAVLLPASCAEDEADTAFDLELTPDPLLGSAEQIAEQIDTVLMVVDSSPEGLYLPSDARVVGNVQIKNVDADAWFELVVTVPVPPGRLPWIRLRQGGLPPEKPLDIRVSGLRTTGSSVDTVALGRVQGLRFTSGSTQAVTVPFNIRSELLPPRVLEVSSVETAAGCRVEEITVVFSKPIDEPSLRAAGVVVVTSDAAPPGGAIALELRLEPSGYVLIYVPADLSATGADQLSYQVHVGTGVRDRNDTPFDQVPADSEAQPYDGDFLLECL